MKPFIQSNFYQNSQLYKNTVELDKNKKQLYHTVRKKNRLYVNYTKVLLHQTLSANINNIISIQTWTEIQ